MLRVGVRRMKMWTSVGWWETAETRDVKKALDAGANVMARFWRRKTPLHLAVLYCLDETTVNTLLTAGASVSKKDMFGKTPLHEVSTGTTAGVIRALVVAGADVNIQDKAGRTALHYACMRSTCENVQALLAVDAINITSQDNKRLAPLHYASTYGTSDMIEILIENGADVMAADKNGMTPMHSAGTSENSLVLLKAGVDVMLRDDNGATPLHYAALGNNPSLVETLLSFGANATAQTNDGKTPWTNARKHSGLSGTKSYWALHDAHYNYEIGSSWKAKKL